MHLLILDDDERIADRMATVARETGWHVVKTATISAFWSSFHSRIPDGIVLDMQPGTSDGIEQLRLLSQQRYAGSIALVSGVDGRVLVSAQEVGRSLGLAIKSVLKKPARTARIRMALHTLRPQVGAAPQVEPRVLALPPAPRSLSPSMVVQAIDGGQMELYLQPIISSSDQKIVGAEGLARWQHPVDGLLLPEQFIPVAEKDEAAIERLTTWALDAAARHYRALTALGLAVPISVNVSGRNLRELDFPDRVAAVLEDVGVPCTAIGLEITETVAVQDRRVAGDVLTRLRLKGIDLSMDDFGTGYSSMEALRAMPFTTLKIDRGFVGDLLTSSDSFNIVRSIIELARTMGMTTIAEGVEEKEVADRLTELGVNSMQGYRFSHALPLDGFIRWVQDGVVLAA